MYPTVCMINGSHHYIVVAVVLMTGSEGNSEGSHFVHAWYNWAQSTTLRFFLLKGLGVSCWEAQVTMHMKILTFLFANTHSLVVVVCLPTKINQRNLSASPLHQSFSFSTTCQHHEVFYFYLDDVYDHPWHRCPRSARRVGMGSFGPTRVCDERQRCNNECSR